MSKILVFLSVSFLSSHLFAGDKAEALRCFGAHNEISKAYQELEGATEKSEFIYSALEAWGLHQEAKKFKDMKAEKALSERQQDGYFRAIMTEGTSQCLDRAAKK